MHPIKYIDNDIETLTELRNFLFPYIVQLNNVDKKPTICGKLIDFDYPTREEGLAIMLAFGGKWEKTIGGLKVSINYTRTEPIDGYTVRIWSGKPPPSCRIEKVVVLVPDHVVLAHEVVVEKLICSEDEKIV